MRGTVKSVLKIAFLTIVSIGFAAAMFGLAITGEAPRGATRGRVLDEFGVPLAGATVMVRGGGEHKQATTNDRGEYLITRFPADVACSGYATARGYQTSSLACKSSVRVLPGTNTFWLTEGYALTLADVKLDPKPPRIYGSIPAVFTPNEKVKFPLRGYSRKPVAEVHVSVYRFDFAERIRARNGRLRAYGDSLSKWRNLGEPVFETVKNIRTDNEGYFKRDITLPVSEVGGYLIHLKLESTESLLRTLITDLALVAKRAPGKTLIYAVSFTEKRPLQGVKLEFFGNNGKLPLVGETDENGLFSAKGLPQRSVTILGVSGESYALDYTYSGGGDKAYKCYIYTDRPVYRPAHKVYFKGILRKSLPGKYVPVAGKTVEVKIEDPEGAQVKQVDLKTNAFGTFNGELELDSVAASGYYSVDAKYGGEQFHGSFRVEEYRKPEFKASVSFRKKHYVGGHKAHATVKAEYYFGAPVAGARVRYVVYKSPSFFYYYPEDSEISFYEQFFEEEDYGEGYYGGYGKVVLQGEGVTDKNGVLKLKIPTKKTNREERYEIEATIMDPSGRSMDAGAGVLVTPGLFTFALDPDNYVYKPGDTAAITIYGVNYDRKRVPNVRAKVSVTEEYRYSGDRRRTVLTRDVRLNSKGVAVFRFKPRIEGSYRIRVDARDRLGNKISQSTWLWVAGDDWEGYDYKPPALELTADKKIYKAGDTARLMINSPEKDCYALFTIEGRRLFEQRIIHLTSSSKVIEVPVFEDYTPNVYASVCFVKGKKFVQATEPMPVSPAGNFLKVKVDSDKSRYQPGESATYRITTLDADGKGVPAEVSLGVVDESLYAVREDRTPNIKKFFYGPVWNMVRTSISFPSEYYGGEGKSGFEGRVRKYFPDTAYWGPTIHTDRTGHASITFDMPDNLTTWRATARAVTTGTAVGSAVQKTLVTKNLLVRLQTPRFFRQRDDIVLTAMVHNYTDREQRVKVWLKSSGLKLDDDSKRTVVLGPEGAGKVEWRVSLPHPGTAKITVYAQGQGDQDALEMTVPILPHGVEQRDSSSGQTSSEAKFRLNTLPDIIKRASVLEMGFSPSIAGAALGMVRSLEDYNYGTAEGLMDVFLPNVVMYQAMKQRGAASPEDDAKIKEMVKRDLRTVYRWQLPGGSWGWGEYGGKDPWMTSYVVYGLLKTKQAGLSVDEEVLKRGIKATLVSMPDEGNLGRRSTMIYVLSLAGQAKMEWIDRVLDDDRLQNYSLALMMLSLAEMGKVERAKGLVPKLQKGAVETDLHCYWPERFMWGFYSCNRYETTACAIRALLAVDPNNRRIPKAIRWLLAHREGDRYHSNYDTASVVYALADYLMVHKPPVPDYTARVYVNDTLVRTFTMDERSVYEPELKVTVTGSPLKTGKNTIRIEKTGRGEVFYWALLKYFTTIEDVPPVRDKVSISRSYFTLELVRTPKHGLMYVPRPLGATAHVGQLIRCRLSVTSPKGFQYLMIDDMLPSGCEVVQREGYYDYWGGWDYWWTGEVVHDNRVSFLCRSVYKGVRVIEYDFRPEIRGSFHVMPAYAQGYFEPDIFAHSGERRLVVE